MKSRFVPNQMTVLLCPLCSQPRFSNLESLRLSLVNAATQSISCPICNEILMGLDKLTIHLFGHSLNQNEGRTRCLELKTFDDTVEAGSYNESDGKIASGVVPAERETGKPVNDCFDVFEPKSSREEVGKTSNLCTVNMEDLSFLTSWDNSSFRTVEDSKDLEASSLSPKLVQETEKDDSAKRGEEAAELSEYMSDLLNKKLPVLNFVFAMDDTEKDPKEDEKAHEKQKEFRCSICDFVFPSSIILSMHEELVHFQTKREKSEDQENRKVEDVLRNLMLPSYECHLCSKSFKMKGSLLVHYRVAHVGVHDSEIGSSLGNPGGGGEEKNFQCSICHKSFKREQHLTQHIKTHEGKQWQCETCNKHFTTKYFLKKHQRLHTGEMPYSCQTCGKTFTFQQSYHKHLLYHSDEKPHKCSQCGRSFKELSTLHNHQRIHSGEKPFACETCGKCFRQRVSYIVHQRIHTGALPYQCTACKKKFRYKVSQRSHKCTAQPPGIVVRQSGDLIQRILEQRNDVFQGPKQASSDNG